MANTPNINLNLPANGSFGWDVPTNANWTTVDSAFGGTSVPKINPAILQVNGSTGLTGITGTGTSVVTNASPTIATPVISGVITSYNGIVTVSNGVPSLVARFDSTAQSANIGATTLYPVPASGAGLYRLSGYLVITQAATVSSTMPSIFVSWTDSDSSVTISTVTFTNTLSTNSVGTSNSASTNAGSPSGSIIISAKASTNISYGTTSYASSGATVMQYIVHLRLEAM